MLQTGVCCATDWGILCYRLGYVVLQTGVCCATDWGMLCYRLGYVVLQTGDVVLQTGDVENRLARTACWAERYEAMTH